MKINLFSSQVGSGVSSGYVIAFDEDNPGLARVVSVIGRSASWNAAEVTVELSHDFDDPSPNWTEIENSAQDADFAISLLLAPGVAFRVRNTDTGSPQTALTVTAVGPIVAP